MAYLDRFFDEKTYHEEDYIGFGKYKNETWAQVKDSDPSYLIWMAGASDDMPDRKKFINSLFTVELSLMPDQQQAADAITEQLIHGDNRVFRLQGSAGFGKSYAVMEIAQRAKQAGYTIYAMATSYVASQVMNESLNPIGVEASTVARSLALRPDNNGFEAKYAPSEDTDMYLSSILGDKRLLIVDEDSFCSDTVVALVFGKMNEPGNNAKLLTVGDKKQLPSPEQDDLCDFCEILPAFELTIPKRFEAGSDLHKLEMLVSQDPFGLPKYLQELEGSQIERHASFSGLCAQMIEDINNHPDETALMLFYRRDAVANANRSVRKLAYGDDIEDVVDGERLRVMRTTFVPVRYNYEKGSWDSIRFYSGTFITSHNPVVQSVTVDFNQPDLPNNTLAPVEVPECYIVLDDNGNNVPVIFSKTEHMADPETLGGREFNIALEQVKQYCIDINNWQLYHYFRSKFVQVAYGYATTVHRSQGASVDRIYLNPKDVLQGGKVAAPLGYVAGTRAKKKIHFVLDGIE